MWYSAVNMFHIFNSKLGKEGVFVELFGKHSFHNETSNNGICFITNKEVIMIKFATSNYLIAHSLEGRTYLAYCVNQIDRLLFSKT